MILVATDFSTAGARAAEVAERLARLRGSRICLLHVFEPPAVTIPDVALDPRLEQELRRRASSQLASAAAELRARGVEVEERLEVGAPPARVIVDVAEKVLPELVVMGRHGRRAVPRLLLGSVAESALLRLEQPVLIVPDRVGEAATGAGGARWHLAVGIDSSQSNAAAVDWVRDFRKIVACDVTFIHLYWPVAEYARFGLLGPRDAFEPDATTVQLLERSLRRSIGTLPGTGETNLKILPNWGAPGERLVEEAAKAGADLLVLGTHHRHWLSRLWHGSTVSPAIHAATLPVVCVSQVQRAPSPVPLPRPRAVLAATDLSELGNRAIVHAYSLVRSERGVVHLLYVHERSLPNPAYAYSPGPEGALTPGEEVDLHGRLMALAPPEATEMGITTQVLIIDGGKAAEVICQTAERLDVDTIVLGSHGRSGLTRALLGSVAAQVLHRAHRPVFVVRNPAE